MDHNPLARGSSPVRPTRNGPKAPAILRLAESMELTLEWGRHTEHLSVTQWVDRHGRGAHRQAGKSPSRSACLRALVSVRVSLRQPKTTNDGQNGQQESPLPGTGFSPNHPSSQDPRFCLHTTGLVQITGVGCRRGS
jgi:hypothetical protein